ncbi:MAG: hypothetical protein EXS16_18340 [Gemmataceae bacterium]|nr:hypothetical protein [Gemmataceae bacterium]
MIKIKAIVISGFILFLTGCTDTVDSISREYRNTNNEGIDAMMMITSDETARRMNIRVFRPLKERYDNIDNRLKALHNNSTNHDFVTACLESTNVHLFLTELEINRQRYTLEMMRLRRLTENLMEKKLAENPDAKIEEVLPGLTEIVIRESALMPLNTNIKTPKLIFEYMTNFGRARNVKKYDKLHEEFVKMRQSLTFAPPDIKLID